jgi:uncharacterized membrane protein YdjX (TVP38/TMEM64 family)
MIRRDRVIAVVSFTVLAALVFVATFSSRVAHGLQAALELVQSSGAWGPVLFVLLYVGACLVFAPGSLLTLGAGFLFGLRIGIVVSSIGSTLGAGAAFLLARTLLRAQMQRWFASDPRFQALDEAVGAQGFKVVLLARLSPVLPFNMLNLAFGLTKITFRDYLLASWIGMLPGALLYVYIGTAAKNLTDLDRVRENSTPATSSLFILGLVTTIVLSLVLTRLARRALNALKPQPPSSELSSFIKRPL